MAKGTPQMVGENTIPMYGPDGTIQGWTTPEYAQGIQETTGGAGMFGAPQAGTPPSEPSFGPSEGLYNPYRPSVDPATDRLGSKVDMWDERGNRWAEAAAGERGWDGPLSVTNDAGDRFYFQGIDGQGKPTFSSYATGQVARWGAGGWAGIGIGEIAPLQGGGGGGGPGPGNGGTPGGGTPGGGDTGGGGGGGMPQPPGGPVVPWEPGMGADTSWEWDFFKPKAPGDGAWGGYDQDYQAFERYQPGMDSPWGMPNIEGGNEDFYQQQFVNLLRDEQGFRNRQRDAQLRQQEAAENPYTAPPVDDMWSWTDLPEVRMGNVDPGAGDVGATPQWRPNQNYNFTPGQTTNREMLTMTSDLPAMNKYAEQVQAWLGSGDGLDQVQWSNWNPNQNETNPFLGGDLSPASRGMIETMFNNIWLQGGQPTPGQPNVPAGYASPTPYYGGQ